MNPQMLQILLAAAGAYFFLAKKSGAASAPSSKSTNGAVSANGIPVIPAPAKATPNNINVSSSPGKQSALGLGGSVSALSLDVPKIWNSLFGSKDKPASTAVDPVQTAGVASEFLFGVSDATAPSASTVPLVPVPSTVDPTTADNTPDFSAGNTLDPFAFNP